MGWKAALGLAAVGVAVGVKGAGTGDPNCGGVGVLVGTEEAWEVGELEGGCLRAVLQGFTMVVQM